MEHQQELLMWQSGQMYVHTRNAGGMNEFSASCIRDSVLCKQNVNISEQALFKVENRIR